MAARKEQDQKFTQPLLDGLSAPEQEVTLFENCLVLEQPLYTETHDGKQKEWVCSIHAQATFFQPDMDQKLLATARNRLAVAARKKSLKPGDRAILSGIITTENITLQSGEEQSINRLTLTAVPQVFKREERVSTTVFALKRSKRKP
jgi:hypothetical protein